MQPYFSSSIITSSFATNISFSSGSSTNGVGIPNICILGTEPCAQQSVVNASGSGQYFKQ